MFLVRRNPLLSYACFLGCAALLASGLANAQSVADQPSTSSAWSSSQTEAVQMASAAVPANTAALPSAPEPAGAAAAQDDSNTYSGWHGHDIVHRLTFEAGGGFAAPAGDKAYITYGGMFTVGGGVNISQNLAMLIEYQFIDSKMPGAIIAEAGAQGGRYHIWSFTLAPVWDLFPKAGNDVYITGGGGFYRKVTNFTNPTQTYFCSYYYCAPGYANTTVGHFSSNQGGFNIGGGYQHRFSGMYGEGKTRFFAEVRYLDVLSPALKQAPGGAGNQANLNPVNIAADTKLLPITVGIRW
jgi:hypothetical protein